MLVTENLSLEKPEYFDPADIKVLNSNADKLDRQLAELKGAGGAECLGYDSSESELNANNVKSALDELAKRLQIVFMKTDIPISERKRNSLYLKITSTQEAPATSASPVLGVKIVE